VTFARGSVMTAEREARPVPEQSPGAWQPREHTRESWGEPYPLRPLAQVVPQAHQQSLDARPRAPFPLRECARVKQTEVKPTSEGQPAPCSSSVTSEAETDYVWRLPHGPELSSRATRCAAHQRADPVANGSSLFTVVPIARNHGARFVPAARPRK